MLHEGPSGDGPGEGYGGAVAGRRVGRLGHSPDDGPSGPEDDKALPSIVEEEVGPLEGGLGEADVESDEVVRVQWVAGNQEARIGRVVEGLLEHADRPIFEPGPRRQSIAKGLEAGQRSDLPEQQHRCGTQVVLGHQARRHYFGIRPRRGPLGEVAIDFPQRVLANVGYDQQRGRILQQGVEGGHHLLSSDGAE